MPYFYFHLRRDERVDHDLEGAEFPSIALARQEAMMAAREIMAERLVKGEPLDADVFQIADADGAVLEEVSFESVLKASFART
ncbi:DUF6894 family protein [Pseudorhizobium pelagicum]|uniref:DUF6894 domain-containing protein n=1 Tax=Pseudorhizobium pelagicum TaxID=1509405 RepID=A0A922TA50_9HYPH|nr:hypothetical protein [Pseudorhizobium pelagicum]KEQ04761.1 hypothetical protein GV68_12280 [Pseudorhizobium pelagicum]KEQ07362.1 hypothetical protein GV67_21505 [Pseudorhizobium pelagicum]